jgi:hypothetical protein
MRLFVPLTRDEFDCLLRLARAERRRPQDQAAVLLSRVLGPGPAAARHMGTDEVTRLGPTSKAMCAQPDHPRACPAAGVDGTPDFDIAPSSGLDARERSSSSTARAGEDARCVAVEIASILLQAAVVRGRGDASDDLRLASVGGDTEGEMDTHAEPAKTTGATKPWRATK